MEMGMAAPGFGVSFWGDEMFFKFITVVDVQLCGYTKGIEYLNRWYLNDTMGFAGGSEVKASACNAGDLSSIPGLGRSPGEGNGNPLQYSCLENPMDGGAWWATVHGVAKSWTQLSNFTLTIQYQYLNHTMVCELSY